LSLTGGIKHKKCQVGRNEFVDFVWAKMIVIAAEMALNRRGLRVLVENIYGSIAIAHPNAANGVAKCQIF
jgi:hypothetical protein